MFFTDCLYLDLQKNFCRGKHRNTQAFKISFVSGDNTITMYRFSASGNKTIFKILCLFLKCNQNIIVSNSAYFDNLQKFSDCLICHINAMGIFSYKIVHQRLHSYHTLFSYFNRRSSRKESISISEEIPPRIPRRESTAETCGFTTLATVFPLRVIKISSLVINSRYFPKLALNSVAVTTLTKSSFYLGYSHYMRF